jgi:hypothetical protein
MLVLCPRLGSDALHLRSKPPVRTLNAVTAKLIVFNSHRHRLKRGLKCAGAK